MFRPLHKMAEREIDEPDDLPFGQLVKAVSLRRLTSNPKGLSSPDNNKNPQNP